MNFNFDKDKNSCLSVVSVNLNDIRYSISDASVPNTYNDIMIQDIFCGVSKLN